MNVIVSSYLLVNAWTDWKRKEIDVLYTIVFVVISIAYKQIMQGRYYWNGMIPGFILLLLSLIWKNHIGMGDGIVVMAFGWMCGLTLVCNVLLGGFALAASIGLICCIARKKKNIELPFVPFFLGSYLLELWI